MLRYLSAVLAALVLAFPALAAGLEFHLSFDATKHTGAFTGRAYVLLFKEPTKQLAGGPNWFSPEPFFAIDVKGVKPGQTIVLDSKALGYPITLDRLPKDTYTVQAVIDLQRNDRHFTRASGNLYTITRRYLDPAKDEVVKLTLDEVFTPRAFQETDRARLVSIESKFLTKFHARPTHLRAGVILPASYSKQAMKRYPVIYEIPGFGGDHFTALRAPANTLTNLDGVEVIHVYLDPNCHFGHHVFADSANNGPYGKALIEELIPAIEQKYRAIGKPAGRIVTGHSSGGWSSLWLQVTYPDSFAGCWSTAPDPIDFRDFQQINIYRHGENMFVDKRGQRRPIARRGKTPVLFCKPFSDMEVVMGHGGQLRSFEAVFSERGSDGQPKQLWDRKSGAIDAAVAKSWEKYDIRLVTERDWKRVGPKLKGKLHVYMGDLDTFYLEGATRLFKASQEKFGSDAVVELFPGRNHSTLLDKAMRERIAREMATMLRTSQKAE